MIWVRLSPSSAVANNLGNQYESEKGRRMRIMAIFVSNNSVFALDLRIETMRYDNIAHWASLVRTRLN